MGNEAMHFSSSNLGIVILIAAIPSVCFPESHPSVLTRNNSRFDQAVTKAKKELVTALEREQLKIEKRDYKNAELYQSAKKLIKAEQTAFSSHGELPFSKNTRTATRRYLSSLRKANVALTNAYVLHQQQLFKAGKHDEAASMIELREKRSTPRLVATWKSMSKNKETGQTWSLYDDLTAEVLTPENEKRHATWNLSDSGLTLTTTWMDGRQTIDRWTLGPQGRRFVSKKGRQEIYRGERVSNTSTSD